MSSADISAKLSPVCPAKCNANSLLYCVLNLWQNKFDLNLIWLNSSYFWNTVSSCEAVTLRITNALSIRCVQVLSGVLLIREPDLRDADAPEDAQLATKVPLLSLDSGCRRHHPQLHFVDHCRLVLCPCCVRHRSFHLQIHRIQRASFQ